MRQSRTLDALASQVTLGAVTPNSAATEHADVDQRKRKRYCRESDTDTEPRESDAAERATRDVTLVMTTPSFDAETCDMKIGPLRLCCMSHEIEILCKMQYEIQRRFRVPVSLGQLLQRYQNTKCDAGWNPTLPNKSWSGIIEAISRCIAAFQNAADATEHSACRDTANKTCDYAIALAHKTPAYCPREDLLTLLHQFMENRTYNLAFSHLLNQVFRAEHEREAPFWSLVAGSSASRGPKKKECLLIIERCMDAISNRADQLRCQINSYKAK